MRFTLVIFGADGGPAKNLRVTARRLLTAAVLVACALAGVIWLGWKVGELTASL